MALLEKFGIVFYCVFYKDTFRGNICRVWRERKEIGVGGSGIRGEREGNMEGKKEQYLHIGHDCHSYLPHYHLLLRRRSPVASSTSATTTRPS